jgi:hypothetical protein
MFPQLFVQSKYIRSNLESHGDRSPNYVFVLFLGSLFALEFVVLEVRFFAEILPYISLGCIVARGQGEELTLEIFTSSSFSPLHLTPLPFLKLFKSLP